MLAELIKISLMLVKNSLKFLPTSLDIFVISSVTLGLINFVAVPFA